MIAIGLVLIISFVAWRIWLEHGRYGEFVRVLDKRPANERVVPIAAGKQWRTRPSGRCHTARAANAQSTRGVAQGPRRGGSASSKANERGGPRRQGP